MHISAETFAEQKHLLSMPISSVLKCNGYWVSQVPSCAHVCRSGSRNSNHRLHVFADCLRVVFNSNQAAAPGLPAAHLGYKVHVHMEKSKVCICRCMHVQHQVAPQRATAIWMSHYCLSNTSAVELHDKQSSCCSELMLNATCFISC